MHFVRVDRFAFRDWMLINKKGDLMALHKYPSEIWNSGFISVSLLSTPSFLLWIVSLSMAITWFLNFLYSPFSLETPSDQSLSFSAIFVDSNL